MCASKRATLRASSASTHKRNQPHNPPYTPAHRTHSNLHTVGIKHKEKLWEALGAWRLQYGPVYKFFFGGNVKVVLSCPEMVRLVCVKHFRVFHDRELMYAPAPKALLTVRDSQISWAT